MSMRLLCIGLACGIGGGFSSAGEADAVAALLRHPVDEVALQQAIDMDDERAMESALGYVVRKAPPDDRAPCLLAILHADETRHEARVAAWAARHPRDEARVLVGTAMAAPREQGPARNAALAAYAELLDRVAENADGEDERELVVIGAHRLARIGGRPSEAVAAKVRGWLIGGELVDPEAVTMACRSGVLRDTDHVDRSLPRLVRPDSSTIVALALLSHHVADEAALETAERRLLPARLADQSLVPYLAIGKPSSRLVSEAAGDLIAHYAGVRAQAMRTAVCRCLRQAGRAAAEPLRAQADAIAEADLALLMPLLRAVGDALDDVTFLKPFADRLLRTCVAAPSTIPDGVVLDLALANVELPSDLVASAWELLGDEQRSHACGARNRAGLLSLLVRGRDAAAFADDDRRSVLMEQAGPQTVGYGDCLLRYLSVTRGFKPDQQYLADFAATPEGRASLLALTPGWQPAQSALVLVTTEALWSAPTVKDGAVWALRYAMRPPIVDGSTVRTWLTTNMPASSGVPGERELILERFAEAGVGEDALAPEKLDRADDRERLVAFERSVLRRRAEQADDILGRFAKDMPRDSAPLWTMSAVAGHGLGELSIRRGDFESPLLTNAADLLVSHSELFQGARSQLRSIRVEAPEDPDDAALARLLQWLAAIDATVK